ncbi:hypothetical protein [Bacillus sp. NEB1478]|uniref:hypothetical protein n=1 Tax=Bacillus sp. NEB1478 TaxID=3073816 RepID=UPI0028734016|nr:hypothetical protein [Bacillus sp. NEB1478]WNB93411.1 hypothetical protein RGB74_07005 [Bacillus sp. NEB1478]
MSVIRYCGDPHSTVKFVRGILPVIGNVTSFQVYFENEDIPASYRRVSDFGVSDGEPYEKETNYTLILRNDEWDLEVWLSGATCGYSGSGPSATIKILQLLGLKINYDEISEKKKIILSNLTPHHDLNILVYEGDILNGERKKRVKASYSFKSAQDKWNAREQLKLLGHFNPLSSLLRFEKCHRDESHYFPHLSYDTSKEWADYATNCALKLNRESNSLNNNQIYNLLDLLGFNCKAKKIDIKEYVSN